MDGAAAAIAQQLQQARGTLSRGDVAGAVREFEAVLARSPEEPLALNALGMIALESDRVGEAESLFERAARSDANAPELWMNVATARRRLGRDDGERDALRRALDLNPHHLGASIRLAELHERRGESPLAMLRWSQVLEVSRGITDPAPAFQRVLDHAREYVASEGGRLASSIESGIASLRDPLDRRDRRRFDACIDRMFGRRQIYQNECHGLHFPFLPADEFFDRQHFPWMPALEAQTPAIREEAAALLRDGVEGVEPYVAMERGAPQSKWSPLDRSMDWSAFHLWRFGVRDDAHCRRCPATVAALEAIVPLAQMGRRTPNVFFSILRPHTRLPAHTGVSNARAIIHLPLIVPPGCGFRVGGETREWREGEAFAFDDTIEHEAWNDSDQPRVILILDVWNPHLTDIERTLLTRYFDVADASGFDPAAVAAVAD